MWLSKYWYTYTNKNDFSCVSCFYTVPSSLQILSLLQLLAVNATLGLKFHHNCRIVSEQARGNLNPLPQYLGLLWPEHPETELQMPQCSRAVGGMETRLLPTCQMFLQLTLPPAARVWHVPLCSVTGTGHLLPGMLRNTVPLQPSPKPMTKENGTRNVWHCLRSDSELPPDSPTLHQAPPWPWAIRNLCHLNRAHCPGAKELSTEGWIYFPTVLFTFQFSFELLGKKNPYKWTQKWKAAFLIYSHNNMK